MPIRPTPSFPTQRAGPGPGMQHPAKTTNCNYLRKCLSFEVSGFFFQREEEKTKTEGLRLHHASLMLIWSRMLEQNMQFKEPCICVFACVCVCEREGRREGVVEREIPAEHPFFILALNKELSILSFCSALDNHFNSNLMKVSTAVGEMGILMYAI